MTLVILAAGMGSRYGGLKQLDPMYGEQFIIDYSIFDAVRANYDKVVFIIKEENLDLFKETIGNRVSKFIPVEYAFQKFEDIPAGCTLPEGRTKPLGTGQAIYCLRNIVKENFAVINADDFYGDKTFYLLARHFRHLETDDGTHICMAGYLLKNTITENGTVSRGVCEVDEEGYLKTITERTKIRKVGEDGEFTEDDGATWTALPGDTVVSMNCWGLTPKFFDNLEKDLKDFMENLKTLPPEKAKKAEFYLPTAVDLQRSRGELDVKVYPTTQKWLGVTYLEDKPAVVEALTEMHKKHEYPEILWK